MIRPRIIVRDLTHRFGDVEAVQGVDLVVGAGEFVALVGPSGCGKTTLLRVLAGLVVPTTGEAAIDGGDVRGRPGAAAYLPQKDLLLPWRRALDNAIVGLELAASSPNIPGPRFRGKHEARERAERLFVEFGLGGFERAWPHELSGGMRQRVAVLRTFLLPHQVVLLDEPFGALDALTRRRMQEWLEGVWLRGPAGDGSDPVDRDPRTMLLVTHDVEEALLLADRVLVLSGRPGRVVDELSVRLDRPRGGLASTAPEFVEMKSRILKSLGANGT